jgi:hypothetical protein
MMMMRKYFKSSSSILISNRCFFPDAVENEKQRKKPANVWGWLETRFGLGCEMHLEGI